MPSPEELQQAMAGELEGRQQAPRITDVNQLRGPAQKSPGKKGKRQTAMEFALQVAGERQQDTFYGVRFERLHKALQGPDGKRIAQSLRGADGSAFEAMEAGLKAKDEGYFDDMQTSPGAKPSGQVKLPFDVNELLK